MIGLDVVLIEEEISLDALVEVGLEVILILEIVVQVLLAACVDECIGEVEADGDHPLALRGDINELLLREPLAQLQFLEGALHATAYARPLLSGARLQNN